ncbi:hypothetical protein MtrunA17_Chr6g0462391 [Medicago truncatula]|uniref:Uncharacterized protein n=1 Tax=Medicago truncatula TaxID=3880 RepID=A0A396HEB1_MEDTR|nr:hypothetical protein MtrunA17_Chr6g0462391 [Medicago truncatula]
MHLWPTKNLRDSFKISYLKKLEWNTQRMKNNQQQRQSSTTEQKLLDEDNSNNNNNVDTSKTGTVTSICHDLLLLLSCCYCCFCCGACVEEK